MSKVIVAAAVVVGAAVAVVATGGAALAALPVALSGGLGAVSAVAAWSAVGVSTWALGTIGAAINKPASQAQTGQQTNIKLAGGEAPLPIVFGRTGTGGYIIYRNDFGTKNAFLAVLIALSAGGPIQGIDQYIMGDGYTAVFGSAAGSADPISGLKQVVALNPAPAGSDGSNLYIKNTQMCYRYGYTPEPDAWPVASGTALPGFDTTSKTSGIAGALGFYNYDTKVFPSGYPKGLWVVRGVKCWDARLDSTWPGGSGSHRIDTPTTWTYTENPYVCALAYILGRFENGKKVWGMGVPSATLADQVDVPSFINGANVADANGWKVGGVVETTDSRFDVLTAIVQAGGGKVINRGAQLSVVVNAPKTSLLTINTADVIGDISVQPAAAIKDRKNRIVPSYREESQRWAVISGELIGIDDWITQDGGQTRTTQVNYPLVQNAAQAHQLAAYDICNSRDAGYQVTVNCGPRLLGVRVGECLTLDVPDVGASGQKCMVIERTLDPATLQVQLVLQAETDSKHAYALGQSQTAPASPGLSSYDPSNPDAPGEDAWGITGTSITNSDGVSVPALVVTGANDDANAQSIIFEYREFGTSDWISASKVSKDTTKYEVTPVVQGKQYEVAISYFTVRGVVGNRLILGPVAAGVQVFNWGGHSATGVVNLPTGLVTGSDGHLSAANINTASGSTVQAAIEAVEAGLSDATATVVADLAAAEAAKLAAQAAQTASETAATNSATAKTQSQAARDAALAAQADADAQALAAAGSSTTAAGYASTASSKADIATGAASTATAEAGIATSRAGDSANSATASFNSSQASATSASSAAASASVATSASISASTTAAALLPSTFENSAQFWTDSYYAFPTSPHTFVGTETFPSVAGYGVVLQTSTPVSYGSIGYFALDAGRSYRLTQTARATAVSGGVGFNAYYGLACFDASGTYIGNAYFGAPLLSGGWAVDKATHTAEEIRAASFSHYPAGDYSGTAYCRPIFLATYSDSGLVTGTAQYAALRLDDVTSEVASAGSASASAVSQTAAAASQTAAGNSASAAHTSEINAGTSAAGASTSAGNASTSAGQAATSASNAAGSASTATSQATLSANSATAAAGSAAGAAGSATTAGTSASAAATSASAASTSATNAATSATSASTYANTASVQAGNASTSASSASSSAAAASSSAAAAQSSATLSASISAGAINADANFAGYATTSGVAAGWNDWANGTAATRASSGLRPGYSARFVTNGTSDFGWYQQIYLGQGAFIVKFDAFLEAGSSWLGAALFMQGPSPSFAETHQINCAVDVDNNQVSGASAQSVRTFTKLINITAPGNWLIYGMADWGSLGRAAKTIQLLEVSIRPANSQEIAAGRADTNATTALASIASNAAAQASVNSAQATTNTTLTAKLARNGNLIKNGGVTNGLANWNDTGSAWVVGYYSDWGNYFARGLTSTSGVNENLMSDPVSCAAGQTYTVSGKAYQGTLTSGVWYIGVFFYNVSDGYVGEASRIFYNYGIQSDPKTGAAYAQYSMVPFDVSGPAPSTAVRMRVGMILAGSVSGGSGFAQVGAQLLKLEAGPTATAFTDEATGSALSASVTVNSGAITTLQGKTAAYWDLAVDAGTSQAFIRAEADGHVGSAISMAADNLALYNRGTNGLIPVMTAISGRAHFYAPVYTDIGSVRRIDGPGFGASSDLLLWFGSTSYDETTASKSNATVYIGTDGHIGLGGITTGGAPAPLAVGGGARTLTITNTAPYGHGIGTNVYTSAVQTVVGGVLTISGSATVDDAPTGSSGPANGPITWTLEAVNNGTSTTIAGPITTSVSASAVGGDNFASMGILNGKSSSVSAGSLYLKLTVTGGGGSTQGTGTLDISISGTAAAA